MLGRIMSDVNDMRMTEMYFKSCCGFQALPYVALLIVMLFFIYAVIGMQVKYAQ